MISPEEFAAQKNRGFTHVPLVYELLADLDTPLSIYLKLANAPYSYLLESAVQQEQFGRYSFIGLPCDRYLKVVGKKIEVYAGHQLIETCEENPLTFLDRFLERFKVPYLPDLPPMQGGLVGYFAYETIAYFEQKLAANPLPKLIDVPDIFLLLPQEIAVLDNFSGKIYLIVYADTTDPGAYAKARDRLEELRRKLRQNYELPLSLGSAPAEIKEEMPASRYKECVDIIRRHIEAGDCMQVVPSRRTYLTYTESPLHLYRALRTINPSPFLFYYHFGDFFVIGSSPELLVRKRGETVTGRPLAGTRKRGATPEEDAQNERDLLQDEKEIAEHVMLIDLGRNDIGKISQIGSVKVTEKMAIERYSHVMHIVSNVEGRAKPEVSPMEILAAVFPAGTLSGAPKIRAMEIIHELEPSAREVYAGAIGYISFAGDMDLAISIRTTVIKDGTAYIQSGGGIVADSDPEAELQETSNKAMALVRAVRMVEAGLDR